MANQIQKAVFHGPKEGLIDIKPLEIPFKLPLDLLFYPLLAIAIALFIYILIQTLAINKKKNLQKDPLQEALYKLDEFPSNLESSKDQAEYLVETLKQYLFKIKLHKALSLDSSIPKKDLSIILNSVIQGSTEEERCLFSEKITNILRNMEGIEYSPLSATRENALESCQSEIRLLITSIDIRLKDLKKKSTKPKKRNSEQLSGSKGSIA